MKEQSLKNHSRYVTGFHVITFGLILSVLVMAIIFAQRHHLSRVSLYFLAVAGSLGGLFFYVRQFAVQNQDRIIRAEENFRCYRLTGKTLDTRLTRSQIIALRFADDSEFVELSEKAASQNLNSTDIKSAIKKWRSDHHRI